ncbi:unnamed protein product [Rotaria sordida]|uniref:Uncharacterized protein n=1 Tax=Rotaria sordida TaxID=392033 RepID=A0A815KKW0_9BILA|nr:unnamed protein product [Rotaria sordida]
MKLYLNLFDFDQLLISIQIGSIEVTCISHTLNTEMNKQHDILVYKMNDELYSKSMINNEKQTSVAKLVNQLCLMLV